MLPFASSKRTSRAQLAIAVHRNDAFTREGALERLFTWLFSGLVYPQIWEDPVVDMDALSLCRSDNVIAIASGGCNVASYLIGQPASITAVDLNAAHVALVKLKLTAIAQMPNARALRCFFGGAPDAQNETLYDQHLAPHLDTATRNYWEERNAFGVRRIAQFSKGFYRYGLLGAFIGITHFIARLHGRDLSRMLDARNLSEQKAAYNQHVAPLFESRLIRWLVGQPASLYGLGIPPAQYRTLAKDHSDGMIGALRTRVEKLAFGFPFAANYFAWQAFGRRYSSSEKGPLPPYLQGENLDIVRAGVDHVRVLQTSMTTHLAQMPAASLDCYVLLDAQDWMNDTDLNALWAQITRTSRPGARVIFRTAADELLLPGRVMPEILDQWRRDDARSAALHSRDRSAIYGAFHLYVLRETLS